MVYSFSSFVSSKTRYRAEYIESCLFETRISNPIPAPTPWRQKSRRFLT